MNEAKQADIDLGDLTAMQAVAVLARGTRAALMDLMGEDREARLVAMAVYLQQLSAKTKEPAKVAGIFRLVANEIERDAGITVAVPPPLTAEEIKAVVDRFLAWPLPASVSVDSCALVRDYPTPRSGTNLLTATEARQMLEYLFAPLEAPPATGPAPAE